jgi:MFS family permease
VPLGDLINRRVLIVAGCVIAAAALVAVAVSPRPVMFLIASGIVGVVSVVQQVINAYAAVLSSPEGRGRILGIVTSGAVFGVLLARTVSGLLADALGWRSIYVVSALLMLGPALVLARKLPPERTRSAVSYRRLITSVVTLTIHERAFRVRSLITLFVFAGFGALWGSVALSRTAAPWHMSTSEVGLFVSPASREPSAPPAPAPWPIAVGRSGSPASPSFCSPCPGHRSAGCRTP